MHFIFATPCFTSIERYKQERQRKMNDLIFENHYFKMILKYVISLSYLFLLLFKTINFIFYIIYWNNQTYNKNAFVRLFLMIQIFKKSTNVFMCSTMYVIGKITGIAIFFIFFLLVIVSQKGWRNSKWISHRNMPNIQWGYATVNYTEKPK